MSKNLMTRIIVAALFIPIILWIIYQGGIWFLGMVFFIAIIASWEFLKQEDVSSSQLIYWLFIFGVAANLLNQYQPCTDFFHENNLDYIILFLSFFFLMAGMIISLGKEPAKELFNRYVRLVWGFGYISVLYGLFYKLGTTDFNSSNLPSNGDWLLFLLALLWVGDSAAMGIGKWLGKHKLAPSVSPNKTVEGFIGGIVGAIAVGLVMYFWKFSQLEFYHIVLISIGCSIFGQLGDLVESMWKRSLDIKDSSALIPGHGGMLDRFDSLLFAAPFMYFYIAALILS